MILNIGCGRAPLEGCVNVDQHPYPGVDVVVDIMDRDALLGHFPESSVDRMFMFHVLEHFRNGDVLKVAENLWTIAKPDAKWRVIVPYGKHASAWHDPDHRHFFMHTGFNCFCQPYYDRCDLGYRGDWQIDTVGFVPVPEEESAAQRDPGAWVPRAIREWEVCQELVADLHAVKPIREQRREIAERFQMVVIRPEDRDA